MARSTAVRDVDGNRASVRDQSVVAAAGIARPEEFFAAVQGAGARVAARVPLRDHQLYGQAEVDALLRLVDRHGAAALVVTPKDVVKLRTLWRGPPLWVLGTEVAVELGADALAARLGIPTTAMAPIRRDATLLDADR